MNDTTPPSAQRGFFRVSPLSPIGFDAGVLEQCGHSEWGREKRGKILSPALRSLRLCGVFILGICFLPSDFFICSFFPAVNL
jgi:hypothetical protein